MKNLFVKKDILETTALWVVLLVVNISLFAVTGEHTPTIVQFMATYALLFLLQYHWNKANQYEESKWVISEMFQCFAVIGIIWVVLKYWV